MSAPSGATGEALASHELRVGEWVLDAERNELRRGGDAVRLEPKAIEVLRQLAWRPGRVVSRDELLSLVWPGVVVGDDALTQAIIKLRRALGDDAQTPRYIETIPKKGYRLVAAVQKPGTAEDSPVGRPRRRAWLAGTALVLGTFLGALLLVQRADRPWPLGADRHESDSAGSFPLVAVLPFANLSGNVSRDYLTEGLTADIIDALGRYSGLRVMSWNAVRGIRDGGAAREAMGGVMTARYLVRGSVREADGTTRVSVELSDAERGVQLWADRYDGRGAQLFEIQDRIVRRVVGALAVKLQDIEQQRAFARPTESAEAYDLVLRARALMRLQKRAANREAKTLLVRARTIAPDYAEVWVALGENEWWRAAFGWVEDPEQGVRRAEALARRALELRDPGAHARAYSLLGSMATHVGQAEAGLAHTSRALAINPSDAGALFGQAHALLIIGRAEESIATFEYAMRLDPNPGVGPHSQLAIAYYLASRYRDAVRQADIALAAHESTGLHAVRAAALAQLGETDRARQAAEAARHVNPLFDREGIGTRLRRPEDVAKLREGLAKAGL